MVPNQRSPIRDMIAVAAITGLVMLAACEKNKSGNGGEASDTTQMNNSSLQLTAAQAEAEAPDCFDTLNFKGKRPGEKNTETETFIQKQRQSIAEVWGHDVSKDANEAHDCQELIRDTGSGLRYQGLLTLWLLNAPDAAHYKAGELVAGIKFVGGTKITNLNIDHGPNCLYVRGDAADDSSWRAWVFKRGNKTCSADDTATVEPLKIWRTNGTAGSPVAVRIIGTGSNRYYIGLQCLDKWCVIGVRDDETSGGPADYRAPKDAMGDYQRMSVSNGHGGIIPSTIWGKITPVTNLASDGQDVTNYNDKFKQVATVEFTGGTRSELSRLSKKYHLPVAQITKPITVDLTYETNSHVWYFRFDGVDSTKIVLDTMPLSPIQAIPGTVRWRWSKKDEGIWVYCPAGCCGEG